MGTTYPTEAWSSLDEFVTAQRAAAQTSTLPERASHFVDHGESIRLIARIPRVHYSTIYLFLLIDFLTVVAYWFTVKPSHIDQRVAVVMIGIALPIAGASILLCIGWATTVLVSDRRIVTIGGWLSSRVSDEMPLTAVSGIVMTRRRAWRGHADTYVLRLSTGGEKELGWLEFRTAV